MAQLLTCLRNVKMSVEYKHSFVISKMNQKEAKTIDVGWYVTIENNFPYR